MGARAEVERGRPTSRRTSSDTVRQAVQAGVIDELRLDIAPVLLGAGERIFDGIAEFDFEPVEVRAPLHGKQQAMPKRPRVVPVLAPG